MDERQCRWCDRVGYHESTCPEYPRRDGFQQASAFYDSAHQSFRVTPVGNGEMLPLYQVEPVDQKQANQVRSMMGDLDELEDAINNQDQQTATILLDSIRRALVQLP